MTQNEPWTRDDDRIRRTRLRMREAEELLLNLRDELNDNISQRRATLGVDVTLCPVCGRVLDVNYETGLLPSHESDYPGRQCRGTGLPVGVQTFDGGL